MLVGEQIYAVERYRSQFTLNSLTDSFFSSNKKLEEAPQSQHTLFFFIATSTMTIMEGKLIEEMI